MTNSATRFSTTTGSSSSKSKGKGRTTYSRARADKSKRASRRERSGCDVFQRGQCTEVDAATEEEHPPNVKDTIEHDLKQKWAMKMHKITNT